MTGTEITLLAGAGSAIAGAVGWWGRAWREKFRAGVEIGGIELKERLALLGERQSDREALVRVMDGYREDIREARGEVKAMGITLQTYITETHQLETKIGVLTERQNGLREQLSSVKAENEELKRQIIILQAEKEALRRELAEHRARCPGHGGTA